MSDAFSQHTNLLRAVEEFTIEDGQLVRRMARGREARWPLGSMTRATLVGYPMGRRSNRLSLQLSFHRRRGVVLTSHSIAGLGRFDDRTAAFKAFGRRLLNETKAVAPSLRLARSGAVTASSLWWVIAALACGALVVVATAMASGATALGLDLGARLTFLLLLAACALPWTDRLSPSALDPDILLAD
jgi:hypothetical protein